MLSRIFSVPKTLCHEAPGTACCLGIVSLKAPLGTWNYPQHSLDPNQKYEVLLYNGLEAGNIKSYQYISFPSSKGKTKIKMSLICCSNFSNFLFKIKYSYSALLIFFSWIFNTARNCAKTAIKAKECA